MNASKKPNQTRLVIDLGLGKHVKIGDARVWYHERRANRGFRHVAAFVVLRRSDERIVELVKDDTYRISDHVEIVFRGVSGNDARLLIHAPASVQIVRSDATKKRKSNKGANGAT